MNARYLPLKAGGIRAINHGQSSPIVDFVEDACCKQSPAGLPIVDTEMNYQ